MSWSTFKCCLVPYHFFQGYNNNGTGNTVSQLRAASANAASDSHGAGDILHPTAG